MDEVLHPDTIASFNGKTVVNEHPEGDAVHIENEAEVNCGHIQDVKRGPDLPASGDDPTAVTLMGDLHIKDSELADKIWPGFLDAQPGDAPPENGVRDISCGYSLKLKRLSDGTLAMTHIRGNHVAVVEKGRAGKLIAIGDKTTAALEVQSKVEFLAAIGDSAPPEIKKSERRFTVKSIKSLIFGHGLKVIMPDASKEEVDAVLKDMEEGEKPGAEGADKGAKAKDSLSKQDEIAAEHPHRQAAHSALDRALDARGSSDHMGKDAFGKPQHLDALIKEVEGFLREVAAEAGGEGAAAGAGAGEGEKKEPPPVAKAEGEGEGEKKEEADDDKVEIEEITPVEGEGEGEGSGEGEGEGGEKEEEKEEEKAEDSDEDDDDEGSATDHEVDDKGKSVLHAVDSAKAFLKISKPIVAAIAAKPAKKRTKPEQMMLDSYNNSVRGINDLAKDGGAAYKAFSKVRTPPRIPGLAKDAAAAAEEARIQSITIAGFYEGVPYSQGKAKHDAYLREEAQKKTAAK